MCSEECDLTWILRWFYCCSDIDTLEMVLDTIAFGDIQGEDTRHFTEANFVKIFRLAQLMVHVVSSL